MANTQKYLNHLLQGTGITPACSEEERTAADQIAEVFSNHGFEPEIQEFSASGSAKLATAILGIVLFVASVLMGIGGLLGVLGTVLAIACGAAFLLERTGRIAFPQLGSGGLSQNVIAYHKASGPLASPRNRPVVIVAHYDSPRADLLSQAPLASYRPVLAKLLPASILVPAVLAVIRIFPLPEAAKIVLWVVAILVALVPLLNAVAVLLNRFVLPYTLGAVCNKSSVAAMLGVMDAVAPFQGEDEFPNDVPFDEYMAEQQRSIAEGLSYPAPSAGQIPYGQSEQPGVAEGVSEYGEQPEYEEEPYGYVDEAYGDSDAFAYENEAAPAVESPAAQVPAPAVAEEPVVIEEHVPAVVPAAAPVEEIPAVEVPRIPMNAAGFIRFGADKIRSLGIVSDGCEIEYEPGAEAVVPEPVVVPAPVAPVAALVQAAASVAAPAAVVAAAAPVAAAVSTAAPAVEVHVPATPVPADAVPEVVVAPVAQAPVAPAVEVPAPAAPAAEAPVAAPAVEEDFLTVPAAVAGLVDVPLQDESAYADGAYQEAEGDELWVEDDQATADAYPVAEGDEEYIEGDEAFAEGEYMEAVYEVIPEEEGYVEEGYEGEGYADAGYGAEGYATEGYEAEGYEAAEGYESTEGYEPSETYESTEAYESAEGYESTEKLVEGDAYATDGYAAEDYAAEGYISESYVREDYAAEGYAPEQYAAEGYEESTYEPEAYAEDPVEGDDHYAAPVEAAYEQQPAYDETAYAGYGEAEVPAAQGYGQSYGWSEEVLEELELAPEEELDIMPAIYEQLDPEPIVAPAEEAAEADVEDQETPQEDESFEESGPVEEPAENIYADDTAASESDEEYGYDDQDASLGQTAVFDPAVVSDSEVEEEYDAYEEGSAVEGQLDATTEFVAEDEAADAHAEPFEEEAGGDDFVSAESDDVAMQTEMEAEQPAADPAPVVPLGGATQAFDMRQVISGMRPTSVQASPTVTAPMPADQGNALESTMAQPAPAAPSARRPQRQINVPTIATTAPTPRQVPSVLPTEPPVSVNRAALFDLPDPSAAPADPFANIATGASTTAARPATSSTAQFTVISSGDTVSQPDPEPEPQHEADAIETISAPAPKPEKRRRGLAGLFGRKKKKQQDSMSEWLGVDEDFDAKRSGRSIGSWDNFEQDDDGWKGGAAGVETMSEEELREAVTSLGDDELLGHDIWFVATGSSENGNAGIKAFLGRHRDKLRGVFLINLECVGAGRLAMVAHEGERRALKGDKRIMGLISRVANDFHYEVGTVDMPFVDTDAHAAMEMSLRSVTLAGIDGSSFACSHSEEDIPVNVDPHNIAAAADIVTEVIRRS